MNKLKEKQCELFWFLDLYCNYLFNLFAERFEKEIGSKYGIVPGSRDNSLYNALWVAQALLRKG